ncbi:hypothetical protein F66182_11573, partial [Fusarium sp. NRRL 66182]
MFGAIPAHGVLLDHDSKVQCGRRLREQVYAVGEMVALCGPDDGSGSEQKLFKPTPVSEEICPAKLTDIVTSTRCQVTPAQQSSFVQTDMQQEEPKQDTTGCRRQYLDGLRGVACLSVYLWHFSWPYQPQIFFSYGLDEDNHALFQLPFISLLYAGDAMVRVFFVLSGFVLSEKLMVGLADGNMQHLAEMVSSMGIRRGCRLFLPPLCSSIITLVCALAGVLPSPADDTIAKGHIRTPIHKEAWTEQIVDWSLWVCHLFGQYHQLQSYRRISLAYLVRAWNGNQANQAVEFMSCIVASSVRRIREILIQKSQLRSRGRLAASQ